jgi:Flp pilus assembly protein TadD
MTASSALDALLRRADPADAGAQNNLGVLLHRRGRADDARAAFARALALDPAMELARRNLVATDAATGARRERELRARLRVDGADHDARRELARLLAVDGRHEAAYAELTALESLFPGDVGVLIERARVEHASGALDAAARTLARAAARAPRSATIRALLAEVTYHRGDPAGALALLGEALALAPDDADVQLLHGFVLGELGRADAANAARAKAVALNPALGRADANLTVRPTGGPVHRSVSPMSAGASGASSGAPAAAALAHPPARADPTREDRREPPEAHLALANAFRRKGYLDEALREYRRAAAVGARPECVARALGTLHLERGAPAAAVTSWRRLVTRAPSDADAWLGLGVASHLAGDAAGARSAYARVVAALPGAVADRRVAQARTGLALLQWADGDVGHAAAALARVVSDVGLPAARVDLVTALAAAGEHARAVEAGRALVRDLPGRADAWTALGRVLAHLGRPAEARAAFARALDLAPDDVAARYGVAFAAAALGEHDLARRETERALAASALVPAPRLLLALDVDG